MDAPSSGKPWDYGSNTEPEACAWHVTRDTTHPLLFSQKEGKLRSHALSRPGQDVEIRVHVDWE